jgi:hypothetical protein
VAKLNGAGEEAAGVARCPGAESCDRWRGAPDATEEENQRARESCPMCEGRGPLDEGAAEDEETEWIVGEIERLVDEQRAGVRHKPARLDPLTWELLLHWLACERAFDIAHRAELSMLVALLRGIHGV